MILKNLFTVQHGETDIENRLMDMGRGEDRVRGMERITWKLTLLHVKWIANGNLLNLRKLKLPLCVRGGVAGRWGGVSKGRGHMYTYG